ncbi:4'-phosphopantetheinyl transferase superfamily protein [Actinoplanes sp. NPDC048796]|uniref:4'-phosphopantetheinyl transferase family protein n=1 Tax=Actinoplanes sp. NPDC048796 TaxID=3155640 RepID=UPI0033D2D65F
MIAGILPRGVAVVEAYDDSVPAPLFPAEEELVRDAVAKRRSEFSTARRCAREALAALGYPPRPILTGERGAPAWPAGVVGSITHCAGYRTAVVAPAADFRAIGVDAEPNEPLPEGVLEAIALPGELDAVAALRAARPGTHWDRLLFCAKEAVYKAWFPLTLRWLGFEEAEVRMDPSRGRFEALLRVGAESGGRPLTGFSGRFVTAGTLMATAIAVPARS